MVPDWIVSQIGAPPTDPKHYGPYQNGEISWEEIPQEIKDRWREWNRQEEDLVVRGLEKGNSLEDLGYKNAPDQGKSMFARFGQGGLFSEYGANVDPGWVYDWASGRKYNKGTSDKYANGELGTRWEPISQSEWQGYQQAQQLKGAGLNTYGQQATAASFNRIKGGHFQYDPKSGNYYNVGLGNGNDPSTWEWVDPYGRKLNNYKPSSTWLQEQKGVQAVGGVNRGQPGGAGGAYGNYGVSNFGGGGYGGSFGGGGTGGAYGGGMDPYGFGGVGAFGNSPGQEATYWGQANLNNVMAESMRNDILAQQLQLQKGLEGRALGGGIYDYLLNEVYGPVLGAQFKGNDQGVSNFVQQQQQQIKQPSYGTEYTPGTIQVGKDQSALGGQTQDFFPGEQVRKEAAYEAEAQGQVDPSGQVGKVQGETQAPSEMGVSAMAAPGGQVGKAPAYVEKEAAQNYQGPTVEKAVLDEFEADLANGKVPKESARTAIEQELQRNPSNQRAQQLLQQVNVLFPKQTGQGVGVTQSTAQPLPKGSYTQTGTQALDPNMSNTWARFLAPTWGKINEAAQSQQQALAREMPRGGEADRAQSQAINQRYGALQQGWQQMVPQALQGISDIGKEMYFQQPMGPSGAMQTAANLQLGNAQLKENQRQFNTTRQDALDAKPSFLERLGGGLAGYVQGNMQAGGQALMSMSDERSKKDVAPFRRSISELRALEPVSYAYNGKYGTQDGDPGVSVMAQQLEQIMPEAVVTVKTPDGPAKAILPLALQMATINAVKDLDRRISNLTGKK